MEINLPNGIRLVIKKVTAASHELAHIFIRSALALAKERGQNPWRTI